MKRQGRLQPWITVVVLLFLYTPILVVVASSFNASKHSAAWGGFTLRWYGALVDDRQAWAALVNTVLLASISTAISTLIGSALAYSLKRYATRPRLVFQWILSVPIFLPDIAMAASLLLFFALVRQWTGWFGLGLGTMMIGHVTFQIPFVSLVVGSRLAGLDPALEEAARDLGASHWPAFWRITFPLIWPGILAGALLAFTLSLDDFVVSFFTSGPGSTTLPILIYASVKRGLSPEVNALSTLIVLASVAAVLAAGALQRRNRE